MYISVPDNFIYSWTGNRKNSRRCFQLCVAFSCFEQLETDRFIDWFPKETDRIEIVTITSGFHVPI